MKPTLQTRYLFSLKIDIGKIIVAGDLGHGTRRVIPILGGTVDGVGINGDAINGTIFPFGADFQIVRPNGFIELEAKYAFELDDGAVIYIDNIGIRFAAPDVLARLNAGEAVDPNEVYFRSVPKFETGDPRYRWLMENLFIGVGARHPAHVEIDVHQVL